MTLHLGKPVLDAAALASLVRETRRYGTALASPWLSIVVVAYREEAPLLALLDELAGQIAAWPGPAPCELILVDNGLAPEIREAVDARLLTHGLAACYLMAAGNLGCSQGRNLGVAHAGAPWVAFLDADGAIDGTYLRACAEASSAPGVVAIRGRVRPLVPTRGLPSHYDLGSARRAAPISAEGISLWRRAHFVAAGGFEAALAGGEGPVLCYRMTERLGVPPDAFVYEPGLWLWHDYYADEAHLRAKLRRYAAARLAIDRRYPLYAAYLAQFARLNARRGLPAPASRASARVMVAWTRARLEAELTQTAGVSADGCETYPSARISIVYHAPHAPSARSSPRAQGGLGQGARVEVTSWGRGGAHATLLEALQALRDEAEASRTSDQLATSPAGAPADVVLVVPVAAELAQATLASVANIFEMAPEAELIVPWMEAPAGSPGDTAGLPGEVYDAGWLARCVHAGPWAVRRSTLASRAFLAIWRDGVPDVAAWSRWLGEREHGRGRVRALRVVDSLVPPRVRRARWPSRLALAGVRAADHLLGLLR